MIFYFLYYFSSFHFIFIYSRFISFFLFSFFCFSPPHKCPAPFLLFFFSPQEHSNNSFASHQRERERERERERAACSLPHRQGRSRLPKGQSRWRSTFTMQHYHVCCPTAARPPPHHEVRSD